MENTVVEGVAKRLGDHVNTDVIIPATYLVSTDYCELGKHFLEGLDETSRSKFKPGDIVVAGKNFGSGSSREHAALAIKGAGISCVIASSFARIFFRNAINVGLPICESPVAVKSIMEGDSLRIDLSRGTIENITGNVSFPIPPYPDFLLGIIDAGGLINLLLEQK
ncbi:MAG: 3-isopropylmalate dehydratase small subunit [Actinomycetota bacterium]|nr:3-isopropylmalate dehydratase small subunit [Actinomycetota bacterium]